MKKSSIPIIGFEPEPQTPHAENEQQQQQSFCLVDSNIIIQLENKVSELSERLKKKEEDDEEIKNYLREIVVSQRSLHESVRQLGRKNHNEEEELGNY